MYIAGIKFNLYKLILLLPKHFAELVIMIVDKFNVFGFILNHTFLQQGNVRKKTYNQWSLNQLNFAYSHF